MFAVFNSTRKLWKSAVLGFGLLGLAACEPIELTGLGGGEGQRIKPGAAVPVALLVPSGSGNGNDDQLARSLENAARLAASQLQGASIDLRVYPTAGNASVAADQARKAVDEGAKIILGPVYAEAANAVGVAVAGDNVNVLAFSNNPTIAGGNVFILGSTFRNTANRMVSYAASQGRGDMVVVYGKDVPGVAGRDAIAQAAAASSARVVQSVGYDTTQQGVSSAVPQIRDAVRSSNADAVFMTSTSSGALPLYAALLPEAGIKPSETQFIGLTRWDIPAQTMALSGLENGWFAVPDPNRASAFATRYVSAYGAAPHPIGGLAFDGIAAIGALAASNDANALTRSALTQPSGFQGTTGVFRLLGDGTNQRALAVATIQGGQRVILDPAPQSFGGF